jgi:hypothetical protein
MMTNLVKDRERWFRNLIGSAYHGQHEVFGTSDSRWLSRIELLQEGDDKGYVNSPNHRADGAVIAVIEHGTQCLIAIG